MLRRRAHSMRKELRERKKGNSENVFFLSAIHTKSHKFLVPTRDAFFKKIKISVPKQTFSLLSAPKISSVLKLFLRSSSAVCMYLFERWFFGSATEKKFRLCFQYFFKFRLAWFTVYVATLNFSIRCAVRKSLVKNGLRKAEGNKSRKCYTWWAFCVKITLQLRGGWGEANTQFAREEANSILSRVLSRACFDLSASEEKKSSNFKLFSVFSWRTLITFVKHPKEEVKVSMWTIGATLWCKRELSEFN